jgi:type I restriction enzyme M protein
MIDHLKPEAEVGGRASIIMNGSPLFTGDAGSGESNIRRWLLENDYVEAIIALPEQIFYNTGIATYVWVVTNAKDPERAGRVQLIDASGEAFWEPMRKSQGGKRRELSDGQIDEIARLFRAFDEAPTVTYTDDAGEEQTVEPVQIFPTEHFGYRKIRVERPLRVNLRPSEERIERLWEERAFQKLAESKKKDSDTRAKAVEQGQQVQRQIIQMLEGMPDETHTD